MIHRPVSIEIEQSLIVIHIFAYIREAVASMIVDARVLVASAMLGGVSDGRSRTCEGVSHAFRGRVLGSHRRFESSLVGLANSHEFECVVLWRYHHEML